MPTQRVCVFCGANAGNRSRFRDRARELGAALGRAGIGLVYGGSAGGLMGAVAGAAMREGAHVIGVIPRHLAEHDPIKVDLDECRLVDTMHERKSTMYDLADAFIALPGGFGTLDELFEIITWRKLGLHGKPVVLLNVEGYFDPLLHMVDHAAAEGFIAPGDRELLRPAHSVAAALAIVGRIEVGAR
jgi:uncharacterized protein (TIGR00730 family)